MRGLLFAAPLAQDEGFIFQRGKSSRLSASVHTLGMGYSIAVIWLDQHGVIVDQRCAKPWRLACVPNSAAKTVIEAQPSLLVRTAIGDKLTFDEVTS